MGEDILNQDWRKSPQWRAARNLAKRISDGECHICEGKLGPLDFSIKNKHDDFFVDVDHIIPVAMGGAKFDKQNLQCAHHFCNQKKGARLESNIAVKRAIYLAIEAAKTITNSGLNFIEEEDDNETEES